MALKQQARKYGGSCTGGQPCRAYEEPVQHVLLKSSSKEGGPHRFLGELVRHAQMPLGFLDDVPRSGRVAAVTSRGGLHCCGQIIVGDLIVD